MSSPVEETLDKAARIAKAVSSLADDYHRRGGYLSGDHVLRAVEKRGLDPEDDVLIRQQLRDLGVEIDDPESAFDFERLDETDARSEDLVRKYLMEIGSIRLLKPQDEIILARRIQAGSLRSALHLLPDPVGDHVRLELRPSAFRTSRDRFSGVGFRVGDCKSFGLVVEKPSPARVFGTVRDRDDTHHSSRTHPRYDHPGLCKRGRRRINRHRPLPQYAAVAEMWLLRTSVTVLRARVESRVATMRYRPGPPRPALDGGTTPFSRR